MGRSVLTGLVHLFRSVGLTLVKDAPPLVSLGLQVPKRSHCSYVILL